MPPEAPTHNTPSRHTAHLRGTSQLGRPARPQPLIPHRPPPKTLEPAPRFPSSPTSPRPAPRPQTPSTRHRGLPASGPEARPRHEGPAPPPPPLMPVPGGAQAEENPPDRALRKTAPGDPRSLHSSAAAPGEPGVPSSLSGPSGRQSPGRGPPAPLPCPQPLERREKRFPGTHLEPVVNISSGFPSTNSSARLSPPLPPPLSPPRARLPSAPPPPSARRPARPPLTSAAALPVEAGRRRGKGRGCPQ
ncbi:uncharacterized protein [Dipodomys merriami]|uniref:uncharacterized protein n=1 Tax=Dipodomys merriami TaxID=94247 RepID=UPI0038559752